MENYANKIKVAEFVEKSFTPEGENEAIQYTVLALTLVIDGKEKTFDFKSKNMADKETFFDLAETV